jgi:hypothetical protein
MADAAGAEALGDVRSTASACRRAVLVAIDARLMRRISAASAPGGGTIPRPALALDDLCSRIGSSTS